MRWISASQQQRDHNDLRKVRCSCGHDATATDPLVVTTSGMREHSSHVPEHERQR